MRALIACLIRLQCATQPTPPQDAGKVLALCPSTSYPEGCRNVAHISRHRVQIKVAQRFQALMFFEPASWRGEAERVPDAVSLSRESAVLVPRLPVQGCRECLLTHIPSRLAGMRVATSGSCLPTSVGSAQMCMKPLSTFTPAWQQPHLLMLGKGRGPGPGSLQETGGCLPAAAAGPASAAGAASLPVGGARSHPEQQPSPAQPALVGVGGNREHCRRTGGTGAGP